MIFIFLNFFEISSVGDSRVLLINCKESCKDLFKCDQIINQLDLSGSSLYKSKNNEVHDLIIANGAEKNSDSRVDEEYNFQLVFNEVMTILTNQLVKGSSIIKVYNMTSKPYSQILQVLSSCYERVFLIKPRNSRDYTNEHYIVCLGRNDQKVTFSRKDKNYENMYIKSIGIDACKDIILSMKSSNEKLTKRKNECLKKNSLDTKQNTLAVEFCHYFFGIRGHFCSHKIEKDQYYICTYCDTIIIEK